MDRSSEDTLQGARARPKRLALIASKGTLEGAYPPYILASTAAAMEMEVAVFFTFYGLPLLLKDLGVGVSPQSGSAAAMRSWSTFDSVSAVVPGFDSAATSMLRETLETKGAASIEMLRDACVESGVRLIGCQMTMDLFGFGRQDLIDGVEIGGAATFLEFAADADISLFV